MLMPKKTKYRKEHKRSRGGVAGRKLDVSFGSYGLKALEEDWISSRQIESARKVIAKYTKKGGKMWVRIFPDKPVTEKGGEMPMGTGKGELDHYVAVVKPGTIMFELDGLGNEAAQEALHAAAYKLPIKCKVITR